MENVLLRLKIIPHNCPPEVFAFFGSVVSCSSLIVEIWRVLLLLFLIFSHPFFPSARSAVFEGIAPFFRSTFFFHVKFAW